MSNLGIHLADNSKENRRDGNEARSHPNDEWWNRQLHKHKRAEKQAHEQGDTYKTKLKLDKEVGGGGLSELCTITYLIAYPYA